MGVKDVIIRIVYGRKEAEGAAYEPIAEETYINGQKVEGNADENAEKR